MRATKQPLVLQSNCPHAARVADRSDRRRRWIFLADGLQLGRLNRVRHRPAIELSLHVAQWLGVAHHGTQWCLFAAPDDDTVPGFRNLRLRGSFWKYLQ